MGSRPDPSPKRQTRHRSLSASCSSLLSEQVAGYGSRTALLGVGNGCCTGPTQPHPLQQELTRSVLTRFASSPVISIKSVMPDSANRIWIIDTPAWGQVRARQMCRRCTSARKTSIRTSWSPRAWTGRQPAALDGRMEVNARISGWVWSSSVPPFYMRTCVYQHRVA